jgi:TPR repeat protein
MLDESPARAAQAILLAARAGLLDAQALLGQILLEGRGIAGISHWRCAGSGSPPKADI